MATRSRAVRHLAPGGLRLALAALLAARAAGAQEPEPVPVPTPPPELDLSGEWLTDDGLRVQITQDGASVVGRFSEGAECPYGGSRSYFIDGRLRGTELEGKFYACSLNEQLVRDCGVPSAWESTFTATATDDTISGERWAEGWHVDIEGGRFTNCRKDSRYDDYYAFSLARCSATELDLSSEDDFTITTDPEMPDLKAEISPPLASASWEAEIKFKRSSSSCSGGPDFDSGKQTGTGASYEPVFGALYGGELKVSARTPCGDAEETEEILGEDPGKPAIQDEIGTVDAPFDADDLKRIACQESGQRQFLASGKPLIGGTGDFGIMQICYQRTARALWNWKANIELGRAILQDVLRTARTIPGRVRGERDGRGRVPPPVRGAGPFPEATDFSDAELRLEAIKRYNAGSNPDSGYWQWDPVLVQWVANPRGGVPGYADEVLARSPTCP